MRGISYYCWGSKFETLCMTAEITILFKNCYILDFIHKLSRGTICTFTKIIEYLFEIEGMFLIIIISCWPVACLKSSQNESKAWANKNNKKLCSPTTTLCRKNCPNPSLHLHNIFSNNTLNNTNKKLFKDRNLQKERMSPHLSRKNLINKIVDLVRLELLMRIMIHCWKKSKVKSRYRNKRRIQKIDNPPFQAVLKTTPMELKNKKMQKFYNKLLLLRNRWVTSQKRVSNKMTHQMNRRKKSWVMLKIPKKSGLLLLKF